jgi:phospholipase C
VYFDEHGGMYDHVSPPLHNVPNPDGIDSDDVPPFKFDRLGVRVPALIISPWIDKGKQQLIFSISYIHSFIHSFIRLSLGVGTVVHEPKVNHFEHS